MIRLLIAVTLILSSSTKAEGIADVTSALMLHEGLNQVVEKKRDTNRHDTNFAWDRADITFPCADAIAKAKKAGTLPKIVLNGEVHDAPYCQFRMTLLIRKHKDDNAPVCLAVEAFDAGTASTDANGLENSDAKLVTMLLIAFDDIVRRNVSAAKGETLKDSYNSDFLFDALRKPTAARIWKDAVADLRRELPSAGTAITLLNKAATSKDWTEEQIAEWKKTVATLPSKIQPVLRKFVNLVVADIESRSKDGKVGGDLAPKSLPLEVAMALSDIEREARDPLSRRNMDSAQKRHDYLLVEWRNRHMARNLAQLYCDNLALPKPKAEVHAVVGSKHTDGMRRLLSDALRANEIRMQTVNGALLSDAFTVLYGNPDQRTGKYPEQGVVLEKLDGKPLALTQQIGGARVVMLVDKLEPLDGTVLSTAMIVQHFGPPGALQKYLGIDETKPVPPAELRKLGQAMLDQFQKPKAKESK